MTWDVLHGDCLDVLRTMADNSIDAVVTDPPYGLSFMGKAWDHSVPSVDVWREVLRVLKPGGHLLCFAGTRTQHRMAVAIEDAGFEIRDMIAWVYASGFPKSLDVSKAIDKAAGAEREVVGKKVYADGKGRTTGETVSSYRYNTEAPSSAANGMFAEGKGGYSTAITAPATDASKQWEGWGTALKPALEPITVARKPLTGTVADNVMEYGIGALNIDGCRVDAPEGITGGGDFTNKHAQNANGQWGMKPQGRAKPHIQGRWPANLIHDGSDEVTALFPETASGGGNGNRRGHGPAYGDNVYGNYNSKKTTDGIPPDFGSAARFFYCAKASKEDRDEGCERLPKRAAGMTSENSGQHITRRDEGYEVAPQANYHPTVKPTNLMRYLCRLVTPPDGVILDPFTGSGSTGKAAGIEGFSFIGIELDADYVEIAKARIAKVHEQGRLF